MASTMAMPQIANLPNFHYPMPGHMQGPIPGNFQGGYPNQVPVTVNGPMISGPVVTRNNSSTVPLSPPIQTIRLPVVPVGGGCYNDGMEVVWHGEFSRLFSSFFPPHVWYLSITNSAPQEKWKFYRDSAKVRFCCQDCGNGWTSMKGRVTFWFHLNTATSEGFVQFKLYGQVCKKCSSGKFEYVMWYPEEVSKVMCNLYNKVGQTFYGFNQPPIRIDRRPGRPRNQHNADLCQACRDGECDQGRPVKAVFNYFPSGMVPRPPNPPMPGRPPMVFPPNLPIVIRQPPVPTTGSIPMQGAVNSSCGQIIQAGPSFITAPVTLTSGVQPILTYSVVTAAPKDTTKLAPVDETAETKTNNIEPEESVKNEDSAPTKPQEDNNKTATATAPNIAKKSHAIAIKSPIVNGVSTKKVDEIPSPRDTKPITNGTEKHVSLLKSKDMPKTAIVNPSPKRATAPAPIKTTIDKELAAKMASSCHIVKPTTKGPIINGYAAAAGKPMPKVHAVNGAV